MDDIFILTQEERDQIASDSRFHISGLYQQMLSGDREAERHLGKICGGALVYHRDHCLSPIEEVYAKNDLTFIAERYDGWILEAIDHQKSAQDFEQEWIINNGDGLECAAGDRDPTYTVEDYIAEALSYDEDDLDYDKDFTAADVCRP